MIPRSSSPIPRPAGPMLTVQMVRLDELRQMLTAHRAGVPVEDVAVGTLLTEAIDAIAEEVTPLLVAADAKVEAWRSASAEEFEPRHPEEGRERAHGAHVDPVESRLVIEAAVGGGQGHTRPVRELVRVLDGRFYAP